MRADVHMHTTFSHDATGSPRAMIEGAIDKDLEVICFTDHYDIDDFDWGEESIFDPETYWKKMTELREEYKTEIDMRIGVELGLREYLVDTYKELTEKYPFDFVIGSCHSISGHDPATKIIFKDRSDEEAYRIAFEEMLANVKAFDDFDVLGHIDYVTRYGKYRDRDYVYETYKDILDEILKTLIEKGKGIELNMSGLKYGLPYAHPRLEILKRYKELGGEIITVGADGHIPEHIAYAYEKTDDMLKECGFKYYAEFKDRKPTMIKL